MFSFVFIVLTSAAIVTATFKEECKKLGLPGITRCCKTVPAPGYDKECNGLKGDLKSCEFEICFAKKYDIAGSEDGTLDKKRAIAVFQKEYQDNPQLAEAIINNCINKDLTNLGPKDICELIKIRTCIQMKVFETCTDWDNTGECSGVEELARECTMD